MFPLIEAEVIRRGWLTIPEFIDIVAVAEMTPGTIAVNSATFIGYRIAGFPGSLVATLGVITPSLILLLLLGHLLMKLQDNRHSESILNGLRPAFIALIAMAAFFIGETALIDLPTIMIFGALFVLSLLRKISPFYILAAGALLGLLLYPFH